ncbi:SDR family oxidoreductase [Sphingobium soli]|uniref:SDR family oxidoreductase n=1 Tax=Sphingobium soli TaxID=1591116 RepID=A0ABS8H1U1_9SPHN|nr:SDR family oxidoreductase [Sphingobium soli]MCC4232266.1 SDR family oxidoreductase [Sphingobium soli]
MSMEGAVRAQPNGLARVDGRLAGKVAVITGGASGIGQACAVRFAREGAAIVIADLADARRTVALVEEIGGTALAISTDTTNAEQCEALIDQAAEAFGPVNIIVASAGIATAAGRSNVQSRAASPGASDVVTLAAADFRRVIDVNVTGVMQTARAGARQMLRQGSGGTIIFVASTAGRIPLAGAAPYCVSKAGVWMLTKVMALELAQTGIRINAVGPGYTATPLIAGIEDDPHALGMAMAITPMKRLGLPEEVADACLYLASDESSFVTGQILHPAGGQFTD